MVITIAAAIALITTALLGAASTLADHDALVLAAVGSALTAVILIPAATAAELRCLQQQRQAARPNNKARTCP